MSNHLYGHSSTATGGASASAAAAYSAQSLAEPYHPLSYSYLGSADVADPSKTSAASVYLSSAASGTGATWPPGVDVPSSASAVDSLTQLSIKRSYEALYNQSLLQSEAWYSTNYLVKRPRFELASHLPIYPQRPGEKDCAHYMQMRTCKFGETCRFDHPIWVPEGGIPDWKEIPLPATPETLPVRRAAPDCPFFMKTQLCKFGSRCKFNHPQENFTMGSSEHAGSSILPERPTEPPCSGEVDCPFYLKTGSCKYGVTCRYNHPDRHAIIPPAVAYSHPVIASPASRNIGVLNPVVSVYQTIDPRLTQPTLSLGASIYPQRPGLTECDFYMKTGVCKFGETCRFHHPIDRLVPTTHSEQDDVKLTLTGLPRREGAIHCPYYLKTGSCKYGITCKFDHPPPVEVMAGAAPQGTSTTVGGVEGDDSD